MIEMSQNPPQKAKVQKPGGDRRRKLATPAAPGHILTCDMNQGGFNGWIRQEVSGFKAVPGYEGQ